MKINGLSTITTAPSKIPVEISHLRGYFPSTPKGEAAFLDLVNLWVQFAPASPHDRDFVGSLTRILCLESLIQHNIKTEMAALLQEIQVLRAETVIDRKEDKEAYLLGTKELKSAALESFKAAAEIRAATKENNAVTNKSISIDFTSIVIAALILLSIDFVGATYIVRHIVEAANSDLLARLSYAMQPR